MGGYMNFKGSVAAAYAVFQRGALAEKFHAVEYAANVTRVKPESGQYLPEQVREVMVDRVYQALLLLDYAIILEASGK